MNEILKPGNKVANGFQGEISIEKWKKFSENIKKLNVNPIKIFENIFQRDLKVQQIIVPNINNLLHVLETEEPIIYKGVSYNPYVTQLGENLNILDFFSYLKRSNFRGIILNASAYAVVNVNKLEPVEFFSKNSAKEAIKKLKKWFNENEEIKNSSKIRGKYLESITASLIPQKYKPIVINANEMWKSKKYEKAMQEAIEICANNPKENEKLVIQKYANYNRYNTNYQRWYFILVLAKAIYLKEIFGANIKLGPTSKSNFDSLIKSAMNKRKSNFGFI